jgi:hypothetical protein
LIQQFGRFAAAADDAVPLADPLGRLLLPDEGLPLAPVPVVPVPVLCWVPAEPAVDGAPDIALFSLIWPLVASLQWVAADTSPEGVDVDWADAENAPPAMTAPASRMVPTFIGRSLLSPPRPNVGSGTEVHPAGIKAREVQEGVDTTGPRGSRAAWAKMVGATGIEPVTPTMSR